MIGLISIAGGLAAFLLVYSLWAESGIQKQARMAGLVRDPSSGRERNLSEGRRRFRRWAARAATACRYPRRELFDRLESAGRPFSMNEEDFWGLKLVAGTGLAFLGLGAGMMGSGKVWASALLPGFLGYMLPDLWLDLRIRQRQFKVLYSFPDLLDLMAVCVDGGLSLGQTIQVTANRVRGPLGEEWQRVCQEVIMGIRPAQALKSMAHRVRLPAISSFANALVQGENLGTPIARVLKEQASTARVQLKQAEEARASAVPLILTVCTVLFFLPALLVILLLPNVLAFLDATW